MWRTTQTLVKCTGQTISDFGSGLSHGMGALGSEGMPFPFQDSRNDRASEAKGTPSLPSPLSS